MIQFLLKFVGDLLFGWRRLTARNDGDLLACEFEICYLFIKLFDLFLSKMKLELFLSYLLIQTLDISSKLFDFIGIVL